MSISGKREELGVWMLRERHNAAKHHSMERKPPTINE
jgi:hypothetical protein